jgi:peptidoglycan biosynthesis protein MviN/MurJ (putative lipid II flippase)
MGRDSWRYAQHERERAAKKRMNPVWRGVGCLLLVALALAGYYFASWFLGANFENGWVFIPNEALNPSFVPAFLFPYLGGGGMVKFITAFLFMILGYGILSIAYAILFPIKPGEADMPPVRRSRAKKRR